ncbi:ABC transporter ATP-binding protein [Streptococcus infantis]|uniref:ABC transporter ATP-binding protein n=1 Tax=Streptococcus infantis TaxID=68892 RepID=UPI001CC0B89E|nr:ABC transporter ATP-binding protein [Streptococcus infantis]MBZ2109947.1 ABC transporter ATP-binding protein [Streptococcus infantis]MBZ2111795.1 ABC transporter ATP-binding protein [Streptococcus infantis]MBZ2117505.1 ABC transporter ATP-binding protein [Streptococcus infantis]
MILQAKGLTKNYGDHTAVKDINLEFKKGSFNAILGPNGAGKSTTISMLIGLKRATNGQIIYAPNTRIGVVFQASVLDEKLTVKENLTIRAQQYKGTKGGRVEDLINQLGLTAFQKQLYGTLSGGQKRRVDIARALLSNPDILFLDEPTTGLDIQTRKSIWDLLYRLQRYEGMTIILTTHYLDEADEADQLYIIDNGKVIAQGSAAEIKSEYASNLLKIYFKDKQVEKFLPKNMPVEKENEFEYSLYPENQLEAIDYLTQVREKIAGFEFRPGTMDDAFIALTGREVR